MDFPVDAIRRDFPALGRRVYDRPLVYLDNAATSQKPQVVIDRIAAYYENENSNIHRGVHLLSQEATDAYEAARGRVARFIGAQDPAEVVFTRGTTEGINLVAATLGRMVVGAGDEVVISTLEHHSNIVPWQLLCEEKGAHLKVIPISDEGVIDQDAYRRLLNDRTRIVAVSHISNALGTVNPVEEMARAARESGIPFLVDGAQGPAHGTVDVRALGCDFYAFSGHKMCGPTGIGVLYGKRAWLDKMPPYQGGGDMIEQVTFERTTFADLPHKFEAGTPNIAGVLGLATAVDYLEGVGLDGVERFEQELLAYGTARLQEVEGLRLIGTAPHKAAILSFVLDGIHPYDTGTVLDRLGIAVRTGHHCTQPLMARLGLSGTVRAAPVFYNTKQEIDALVEGLAKVNALFR